MAVTTHRVEVKIEAPRDDGAGNYRSSVFSISLETSLPVEKVQHIVNQLFTALTDAAIIEPV